MKALPLSVLALGFLTSLPCFAFENIASRCTNNQLTLIGDTAGGGSVACVLAHAALRVDHQSSDQYAEVYTFEDGETFTFRLNRGAPCEVMVQGSSIHCDADGLDSGVSASTAKNLMTLIKRAPRVVNLENPSGQSYALYSQLGPAVVCSTDNRLPDHLADTCRFFSNWR